MYLYVSSMMYLLWVITHVFVGVFYDVLWGGGAGGGVISHISVVSSTMYLLGVISNISAVSPMMYMLGSSATCL